MSQARAELERRILPKTYLTWKSTWLRSSTIPLYLGSATNVQAVSETELNDDIEAVIDSKLEAIMTYTMDGDSDSQGDSWFSRSVPESNVKIGALVDAKQYPDNGMKHTVDQYV